MKRYELKYEKGETGVFRMSTVENPATKTQLVMFDDELKAMEFQDDDKQVIYSVAMRPNMLIPRKNINGEPAMVFYTEETVRDLQQNFFKNNSHNGATVNHDKQVRNDMYCFESWIVEDPEKDKATLLGMSVQKGDWVLGQKIDNPDVWQKVKKGELTGFSIEAYLEPVLTDNEINMTQEELDARIKKVLMESQLGKEYDVDGKKYYIGKLEAGGLVTDGEGNPMADVTITIDGVEYSTDENGKIKETEKEEMEEEPKPDEEPKEEGEDVKKLQDRISELEAENNELKAQIAKYETDKTEMSAELEASKKVALEMSEEYKKGLTPSGKEQSEMSALEKYREKKRNI